MKITISELLKMEYFEEKQIFCEEFGSETNGYTLTESVIRVVQGWIYRTWVRRYKKNGITDTISETFFPNPPSITDVIA